MSMTKTKRSLLTTGAAVTLAAAVLMGGGTFAYLSDNTNDTPVINEFDPNTVYVELSETGDGQYDILPGKTDTKDPTVTVTATTDAYVFVTVTDTTGGLVDYTVDPAWTPLGDAYPGVYYREVTAAQDAQSFPVLKDNAVSYKASLTNEDMVNADGSLKTGLTLTFTASAIQKEGFVGAEAAYTAEGAVYASSVNELQTAINNGGAIALSGNIVLDHTTAPDAAGTSALGFDITQDTVLYLNGSTITGKEGTYADALFDVSNGATLTVYGDDSTDVDTTDMNYTFYVMNGTLNIYGGNYFGSAGGCIFAAPDDETVTANVNIYGGTFGCELYSGKSFALNKLDSKKDRCTFTVYGGTFINVDPSANNNESPAENQVAEGYHVESATQENGDIWYTVVPDEAAEA